MSGHLLLLTIGPVQDFIAQARRTRDLWFGSHLLAELARAGARALAQGGARLILPAFDAGDRELEPCNGFLRPDGTPPAPIANKLLAELPEGGNPRDLAISARQAIRERWRGIARAVRQRCAPLLAADIDPVWEEQIETALELYASWAPLEGPYGDVRRRLERNLDARKLLRDFGPFRHDRCGAPKSSLDGARVSVLAEVRPKHLVRRYRLSQGEQLDAVGLVKRAGGEPEQFVPIVNVALARWIETAAQEPDAPLLRVAERARELDLPRVNRPDLAWTILFPFDAQALVASRVEPLLKEVFLPAKGSPEEAEVLAKAQAFVRHELRPLHRVMGEPPAYVACLVADGDRMGATLDRLSDPEAHRSFSRALAGFAAEVRRIVEQKHRGSLVYAGGDDVLAFLPVVDAVPCARALQRRFGEAIEKALAGEAERPTLSVGIGIGHVMEGMGDLLELGRSAERLAKRERNSLAVILDKRSGGRREWAARWDADPAGRLEADAALVAGPLSTKKVHEIGAILRRLPDPGDIAAGEGEAWRRVLSGEVHRALVRNEPRALAPAEVGLELPADYGCAHEAVARWVDRLLIARAIADARPRPRPTAAQAEAA